MRLAGIEWFYGFMKERNPNRSIRTPEAAACHKQLILITIKFPLSSQT
jgi:hypothetical protein